MRETRGRSGTACWRRVERLCRLQRKKKCCSGTADVVHVLTPPNIHFETGCQVIEAGADARSRNRFATKLRTAKELRKR